VFCLPCPCTLCICMHLLSAAHETHAHWQLANYSNCALLCICMRSVLPKQMMWRSQASCVHSGGRCFLGHAVTAPWPSRPARCAASTAGTEQLPHHRRACRSSSGEGWSCRHRSSSN
jgi:hypothetical protein